MGDETVVDYGAGTGRLTLPVAERLTRDGRVVAVEESPEIFERLTAKLAGIANARAELIAANRVPLDAGAAQRVLAVNLFHEVRGERALAEMRRLLAPGGFVLAVDWDRDRDRPAGPPDELLYTAEEVAAELTAAGLATEALDAPLPYHFALKGRSDVQMTGYCSGAPSRSPRPRPPPSMNAASSSSSTSASTPSSPRQASRAPPTSPSASSPPGSASSTAARWPSCVAPGRAARSRRAPPRAPGWTPRTSAAG